MYREHCGTCQVELFSLCFHISTVLPSRSFLFVSNRYGFWCFFMLFTYNSPCEKQGFIKLLIFERRKPAPSRTICACSYEFFFSTSGSCQGHCRETGGLNITSRMSLIHKERYQYISRLMLAKDLKLFLQLWWWWWYWYCSVTKSCPTLCNPVDCSTPGSLFLHDLPECAQIHVPGVNDAT